MVCYSSRHQLFSNTLYLLGHGISEIRNRSLARIFRKAGFMGELGSGISKMIQEMKNSGKPRPEFEEKGQYFCVTPRMKPQMTFQLEEIYRTLRELIALGNIEKTGSGKNAKYRVKE